MRVHIAAHGREVTVDCPDVNVTVREVLAEALVVWRCLGHGRGIEAGTGFVAERRETDDPEVRR